MVRRAWARASAVERAEIAAWLTDEERVGELDTAQGERTELRPDGRTKSKEQAIEDAGLLAVIARLPWQVARTMPELPHEYTLRKKADNDEDYVALFNAIQQFGIVECWKGKPGPYLYPGDGWRYWHMTANMNQRLERSRHINRNRIEEADKLRARGLITPWAPQYSGKSAR